MKTFRRCFCFILAAMTLSSCAGGFIGGGPTLDSGTMSVSGLATGVGAHLELGWVLESGTMPWIVGATANLAGYQGEGDGDPIFFTTIEIRRRWSIATENGALKPFVEAGAGPVLAWSAGPRKGGVTLHSALGVEGGSSTGLGWSLALRERPTALVGGQWEFGNSLQALVGAEWRQ